MTDPRKSSFENTNLNLEKPRYFSDFPRIQVSLKRNQAEDNFKSLTTPERQELMEKLIDRVREL